MCVNNRRARVDKRCVRVVTCCVVYYFTNYKNKSRKQTNMRQNTQPRTDVALGCQRDVYQVWECESARDVGVRECGGKQRIGIADNPP